MDHAHIFTAHIKRNAETLLREFKFMLIENQTLATETASFLLQKPLCILYCHHHNLHHRKWSLHAMHLYALTNVVDFISLGVSK